MSFFDYLKAINTTKVDLMEEDPLSKKDYVPFMINRGLSYFSDTIMYANEMNRFSDIPKEWQFAFYLNGIKKGKRFSKWHKKDKVAEDTDLLMNKYNYSAARATEVLDLFTPEQLEELRAEYTTGGR